MDWQNLDQWIPQPAQDPEQDVAPGTPPAPVAPARRPIPQMPQMPWVNGITQWGNPNGAQANGLFNPMGLLSGIPGFQRVVAADREPGNMGWPGLPSQGNTIKDYLMQMRERMGMQQRPNQFRPGAQPTPAAPAPAVPAPAAPAPAAPAAVAPQAPAPAAPQQQFRPMHNNMHRGNGRPM
jgi:hypothetical protein